MNDSLKHFVLLCCEFLQCLRFLFVLHVPGYFCNVFVIVSELAVSLFSVFQSHLNVFIFTCSSLILYR